MKRFVISLTAVICCIGLSAQQRRLSYEKTDSTLLRKRPVTAAAYNVGTNLGLWVYDRCIKGSEFAKINIKTLKKNIETGFVWDSDRLATNHLGHPFNGGFYFAGARAAGMNYWQSLPYAVAGSFVWEIAAEKEPPGFNDFIATPIGGAVFGEVSHRISGLILDGGATGAGRVGRELASFLVNPVRSVDRLFTGEMWRVRRGLESVPVPFELSVAAGWRYISDNHRGKDGSGAPYIGLSMEYGDPVDASHNSPFEHFFGSVVISPDNGPDKQPLFSRVNLAGRLWSREIETSSQNTGAVWGIWQQYDFYHYRHASKDSDAALFNFSETAAAGLGLVLERTGETYRFSQRVFADVILLGAAENRNLFIIERHYNMGSGFAAKSYSELRSGRFTAGLTAKLFYLNTWKDKDYRTLPEETHPLYYDTPGDKGHNWAYVVEPSVKVNVCKHIGIGVSASFAGLNSSYKKFPDQKARNADICLGISYNL